MNRKRKSYTEMLAAQRRLPVFDDGAMPYYVDVDLGVLREKDNPERIIHFSDMEDVGTHYRLERQDGLMVDLPYMVALDPEGVAFKYGIKASDLPPKDSELRCSSELLADRMQGKLPTLTLYGDTFYVDLRLGLLRPKDDFSTMGIAVGSLASDFTRTFYSFLYNPATHEAVKPERSWKKIPKGIVAVEIPYEDILDPVYTIWKEISTFRERYPFGDREKALAFDWNAVGGRPFIDQYPVRYNLEARIIPWEQTIFASLVKDKTEKQAPIRVRTRPKRHGM